MKKYLIGAVVIVLILVAYYFVTYNRLVGLNESANGQWAQVEASYQRRFDLIPNMVEAVKGFAKQEQTVFTNIAEARTRYSGATSVDDKVKAANQVESALGRLLVIAEAYPDLKSSKLFSDLTVSLEGSENRINVERQRFNDTIKSYNLLTKRFPSSWVASYSGFSERDYFQASAGAENAPAVQF